MTHAHTIIGFTGSRLGMTEMQNGAVRGLLADLRRSNGLIAHHGDCVGADAMFDSACADFQIPRVSHPPTDERLRAFCLTETAVDALSYLKRNRAIVDACEWLIAVPDSHTEHLRSGTWSTIRYALRQNKRHTIVYPCGSTGSLQPIQP